MLAALPASAAPPLPRAGTPAQVTALVAASSRIHRIPADLLPSLGQANADRASLYWPKTASGCTGVTQCAFGDTRSRTSVVLLGDSHALMWLPALVPVATSKHFKLILMWKPSCPATSITVWNSGTNTAYTQCDAYRRAAFGLIHKLAPSLVLLTDRTSSIMDRNDHPTTDAAWLAGMKATISQVKTKTTKAAIIGDITPFATMLPECLAASTSNVQNCATKDPDPTVPTHIAAEQAAAKAKGVVYLNAHSMLCTSVCSPIIGRMLAYFDSTHVSATYAAFLATDWSNLLVQTHLVRA